MQFRECPDREGNKNTWVIIPFIVQFLVFNVNEYLDNC